jgi:outer membrane protein assembly factor BamD
MNLFSHKISAGNSAHFSSKSAGRAVATLGILTLALSLIPAEASDQETEEEEKPGSERQSAGQCRQPPARQRALRQGNDRPQEGPLRRGSPRSADHAEHLSQSEYQMRAKLAVGDAWFKEGGTAALTQAESEYEDFITFFPQAPEAAEAKMKVADIYFMQMEKPDRDFTNAQKAEQKYREMIDQFPDSSLVPRAKQRLRETQEVLAEREFLIGQYYSTRLNWAGTIARLQTVADTYPLYSKSDELWITIGDAYAGEAHQVQGAKGLPGAVRERLQQVYLDKATAAYDRVVTRYPMAPHVEDARDRLVAMNRPVPEPTQEAIAENDAEIRSEQPMRFTDKALGMVKHGPVVVEAAHVGDPTMVSPARTIAPEITKENQQIFASAFKASQPGAATAAATDAAKTPEPTSPNEPPRSDQPQAPLQFEPAAGSGGSGTGVSASIVSAPNSEPAAPKTEDPNAVVKTVAPTNTVLPAAEAPAAAPDQINDVKPGSVPAETAANQANTKGSKKKPKLDESDESSSKKKKKKGLSKLNPF